jgi:hypothetical protein
MPRSLAALLLLAAGLVHVGVTLPRRSQAVEARAELRRLKEARRSARARLEAQERRATARTRAAEILGRIPPVSRTDPLTELRADVLETVRERPLSRVQLQVRPQRPPVGAAFRISASGRFEDALALSNALARPLDGVVFDRVQLRSGPRGVDVEVEALRLGGRR